MASDFTWWERIFSSAYGSNIQERFAETLRVVRVNNRGMHPDIHRRAMAIVVEARRAGLDVEIFEGFRSHKRQDELFKRKTTKARAGMSWHNYGFAFDIVFKVKGKWSWDSKHDWQTLGRIGKKHGLEWGGDWGWDFAHFQDKGNFKNIREAKDLFEREGFKAVWENFSSR